MISSVEITRLRGIREGKLENLTPLVVLVGPNGCGKSTVLDALLIGGSDGPAHNAVAQRHLGHVLGHRWLFWKAETEKTRITVTTHAKQRRTCKLRLNPGEKLHVDFVPNASRLDGVTAVRLIEPHKSNSEPPLYELYSATVQQGRRDEAKAIIAEVVPGIRDVEVLTEGNVPVLHLVFDDHSVPAALAGDGIYALLRISLELAARPRGVVLIEEPEVHQHPGAVRQSVRAILAAVRRDIQVVITTHSLELIDSILAEASEEDIERLSLYRLELEDGRLISHQLPGSEVAFSRTDIEKDLR